MQAITLVTRLGMVRPRVDAACHLQAGLCDCRQQCVAAAQLQVFGQIGHDDIKMGTKWIGTDGWVHVNRGSYDASKDSLKKIVKKRKDDTAPNSEVIEAATAPKLGDDVIKSRLYETAGHHRNFVDCVKSRKPTVTPVETAHRSATPGHLALISFLVNRPIKWDPVKEEIVGDAEASKLLTRDYRGSWKLEA